MSDSIIPPANEIDSSKYSPSDAELAEAVRVLLHLRTSATPVITEDGGLYIGDHDYRDWAEDPFIIDRWVRGSYPALYWLVDRLPEIQSQAFRLRFYLSGGDEEDLESADGIIDEALLELVFLIQKRFGTDMLGALEYIGQRAKENARGIATNRKYTPYDRYLKTEHWQEKRREALDRARTRCQLCDSQHRLEVHHRSYERLGQEMPEDLIVLCRSCHAKFHDKLP